MPTSSSFLAHCRIIDGHSICAFAVSALVQSPYYPRGVNSNCVASIMRVLLLRYSRELALRIHAFPGHHVPTKPSLPIPEDGSTCFRSGLKPKFNRSRSRGKRGRAAKVFFHHSYANCQLMRSQLDSFSGILHSSHECLSWSRSLRSACEHLPIFVYSVHAAPFHILPAHGLSKKLYPIFLMLSFPWSVSHLNYHVLPSTILACAPYLSL